MHVRLKTLFLLIVTVPILVTITTTTRTWVASDYLKVWLFVCGVGAIYAWLVRE